MALTEKTLEDMKEVIKKLIHNTKKIETVVYEKGRREKNYK